MILVSVGWLKYISLGLTSFSSDAATLGGLVGLYNNIRSITKVHSISLRLAYKNYGIIFVYRCPYVRTVSSLMVMLVIFRNSYVWYVMGMISAC